MNDPLPAIEALLKRLQQELDQLKAGRPPSAEIDPLEQLVTLDQCAAIVGRRKRTLEHYRGKMPEPQVRGAQGRPSQWAWDDIRPWLEETFGRRLPKKYPGSPC